MLKLILGGGKKLKEGFLNKQNTCSTDCNHVSKQLPKVRKSKFRTNHRYKSDDNEEVYTEE